MGLRSHHIGEETPYVFVKYFIKFFKIKHFITLFSKKKKTFYNILQLILWVTYNILKFDQFYHEIKMIKC